MVEVTTPMTIDQKARETVAADYERKGFPEVAKSIRDGFGGFDLDIEAARLGIIEGLEMAAKLVEEDARAKSYSESPFESGAGFERIKLAAAIRSLK